MIAKRHLAVDEHDWNLLFELFGCSGILQDVNFAPLKRTLLLEKLQLRPHLVTKATAGLRIDDDLTVSSHG